MPHKYAPWRNFRDESSAFHESVHANQCTGAHSKIYKGASFKRSVFEAYAFVYIWRGVSNLPTDGKVPWGPLTRTASSVQDVGIPTIGTVPGVAIERMTLIHTSLLKI